MTAHSQLLWKVDDTDCIEDSKGKCVSVCVNENSEANASFIVRACNNHEKLVKACKRILSCFNSEGEIEQQYQDQLSVALEKVKQALQSAEGE